MKHIKKIAFFAGVCSAISASAANAASFVYFGDGYQRSEYTDMMDSAFGSGSWTDVEQPSDTSFLNGEDFVYIQAGQTTYPLFSDFFSTFSSELESWISAGGSMLINATPWEGDPADRNYATFTIGGITMDWVDVATDWFAPACWENCVATDPAHPIFTGTSGTFNAEGFNWLSYGEVSGGTVLLENGYTGEGILSSTNLGDGHLMVSTLFADGDFEGTTGTQLWDNILNYGASQSSITVAPVPLPAGAPLLMSGLVALGFWRRRNAQRLS